MNQILVVDDEVGIRELLSEILQDEGYEVRLAENLGPSVPQSVPTAADTTRQSASVQFPSEL